MYCETCPVRNHCKAYSDAEKDNNNSYHPQQVVRADSYDCPLAKLVEEVN